MQRALSVVLALCAAVGAAAARGPATYQLTLDENNVPGPPVVIADLHAGLTQFFDATRLGPGVESAREYEFMGERIAMGYRTPNGLRMDNTYFPGVSTSLGFRFDDPVLAAGAWVAGVHAAGIGPAFGVFVTVYDDQGGTPFSEFVPFPEGNTDEMFVGVVSSGATIKEIEFSPDSIGGIGLLEVRPGGPAQGPCPGDANGDRVVDFLDLNIVLSDFGITAPGLAGDLNGDGACDFLDLNIVLSAFGTAC